MGMEITSRWTCHLRWGIEVDEEEESVLISIVWSSMQLLEALSPTGMGNMLQRGLPKITWQESQTHPGT